MQWCFGAALQMPVGLSLNNQQHLQQLMWSPLHTEQTQLIHTIWVSCPPNDRIFFYYIILIVFLLIIIYYWDGLMLSSQLTFVSGGKID